MGEGDQLRLSVDPAPAPGQWELREGDCLAVLRDLPAASVDSIVTDPPAGIAFMGKDWDRDKGGRDQWIAWMAGVARECLRVIKPGGYALVWALPRTSHWTATAWEDAGWEPRDRIAHVFGSGFPKSANISKQIDKAAGAERDVVGVKPGHEEFAGRTTRGHLDFKDGTEGFDRPWMHDESARERYHMETAPATPAAHQWSGWGTALKPAMEDWWLFRAPLAERTVAANVLAHGVGGLNVDGCRVSGEPRTTHLDGNHTGRQDGKSAYGVWGEGYQNQAPPGRWPANLILDNSEEVRACFPECKTGGPGITKENHNGCTMSGPASNKTRETIGYDDSGSAARFFQQCTDDDPEDAATRLIYVPKASRADRNEGCEGLEEKEAGTMDGGHVVSEGRTAPKTGRVMRFNNHPTVKATALMRYLVRLVTPKGGLVLDPFCGSGSTGKAALLEGFRFLGIEREAEYVAIAEARLGAVR